METIQARGQSLGCRKHGIPHHPTAPLLTFSDPVVVNVLLTYLSFRGPVYDLTISDDVMRPREFSAASRSIDKVDDHIGMTVKPLPLIEL